MKILKNAKAKLEKGYGPAHGYAHLAYFGFVAIEGHGFYASIAGFLFILSAVGLLVLKEEI